MPEDGAEAMLFLAADLMAANVANRSVLRHPNSG
jgi:hypothetical protein